MPVGLKRYAPKDTNIISINEFTGGINYMLPPENIQLNEMAFIENFEYDSLSGTLKTVDGLVSSFNAEISVDCLFYDSIHNVFLFSSSTKLYKTDLSTKTEVGTLTGSGIPFFCPFDDKVVVCSGGRPQYFNGTSLTTITANQPDGATALYADIAFTRAGRLMIAQTNADYLLFSGVGDITDWNFAGTDANAQYVEIGYKDATDIVAVVPLAQDIIIFKSDNKGIHKAFRLSGEFPDWSVLEVSRNADCANKYAALQAFNDVFFIGTNSGFTSLATVQDYGAVKMLDAGAKINRQLTGIVDSNCQLFYVPIKKQLWIIPDNTGDIYVYNFISQTFTKRKMSARPKGVAVKNTDVYVARGTKILRIDSSVSTDDGSNIACYLQTKRFQAVGNYVLKKIDITVANKSSAIGTVTAGGVGLQFSAGDVGDYIYSDTDPVVSDTDAVALSPYQRFTARGNYRCPFFDVTVVVLSGSCAIRKIDITAAEVL